MDTQSKEQKPLGYSGDLLSVIMNGKREWLVKVKVKVKGGRSQGTGVKGLESRGCSVVSCRVQCSFTCQAKRGAQVPRGEVDWTGLDWTGKFLNHNTYPTIE